jgi:hypothetical protein
MKYNHLLIISVIISSITSGMEHKWTAPLIKSYAESLYLEKTVLMISNQPDSHDVSIESTDQEDTLDIHDKKETKQASPRKIKLIRQSSVERY